MTQSVLHTLLNIDIVRDTILQKLFYSDIQNVCVAANYILRKEDKPKYFIYTYLDCGVQACIYDDLGILNRIYINCYTTEQLQTVIKIWTQYVKKCIKRSITKDKHLDFKWQDGKDKVCIELHVGYNIWHEVIEHSSRINDTRKQVQNSNFKTNTFDISFSEDKSEDGTTLIRILLDAYLTLFNSTTSCKSIYDTIPQPASRSRVIVSDNWRLWYT